MPPSKVTPREAGKPAINTGEAKQKSKVSQPREEGQTREAKDYTLSSNSAEKERKGKPFLVETSTGRPNKGKATSRKLWSSWAWWHRPTSLCGDWGSRIKS